MLCIKYCSPFNVTGLGKVFCQPQKLQYSRIVSQNLQHKLGLTEGPKRPISPFLKYAMEQRPLVRKDNPNLKPQEIIKKISMTWNQLDTKTKDPLQQEYKTQYAKYVEQSQKYLDSLPKEKLAEVRQAAKDAKEKRTEKRIRMEKKNLGKPKKPMTSFILFLQDRLSQAGVKSSRDTIKKFSEEWQHCSEKEKDHYKKKSEEERKKYEKEIDAWEKKMIESGRSDLIRLRSQISESHKEGGKENVATSATKNVAKGHGKKTAEKNNV